MKIAIVGSNGLLGEACQRILSLKGGVEVIAISRQQMDLKNLSETKEYLEPLEYDVCI